MLCRFDVSDSEAPEFLDQAERALGLLTARPGCVGGELARATEDSASYVLSVRFESVAAYRRAMSGVEVREHVIPLLSRARVDQHAAHEVALTAEGGRTHRHPSVLAEDAGTVAPGTTGRTVRPR